MAERLEDWSFKQTWPVCETGEWKVKHLPLWSLNLTFRTCFMLNWVHGVSIFIPWMYCDIIFEENCSSKYSALCMRQWTNTGWRPLTATHSSAKSLSSAAGVFQSWAGCCGNSLLWRCQLLAHWSNVEGAVGQAPRVPPQEMLWLDHFHWHLFPLIGTTILLSGNASVATTTFVWHSTMRSNVRNPIMLTPQSPMWSSTAWFWNPLSWSWKTTTYSSNSIDSLIKSVNDFFELAKLSRSSDHCYQEAWSIRRLIGKLKRFTYRNQPPQDCVVSIWCLCYLH